MFKLLLFLLLAFFKPSFSKWDNVTQQSDKQQKIFLIKIPDYLTDGKIVIEGQNVRDSLSITYIFSFYPSSPHYVKDAGFFLDILTKGEREIKSKKMTPLTIYQVMDSLKVYDRTFFQRHIFLCEFL